MIQRTEIRQEPMVGWYDPSQLARTGVKVVVSTLFSQNADFRLMEMLTVPANTADVHDHTALWVDDGEGGEHLEPSQPRSAIWIDYVADVGDGWDATYAIAYQLAQRTLEVEDSHGRRVVTERGDLLIFGGDQVYPTPSRADYEARLVGPYEAALRETVAPHPHVFAVPGNHDWYDSLVAFMRLFVGGRWFGGWRTQQTRSYFAIRLPQGWWLLGTDAQLGSDVDRPQVEYFKRVAAQMAPGDRVILCNAEPHGQLSGCRFALKASWPDMRTSRRLCWRNLLFPGINPWFGFVPGFLYLLLAWSALVDLSGRHGLGDVIAIVFARLLPHPGPWFLVAAVLGAFVLFTDTHSRTYRWVAGTLHGSAHLLAILLIGWGVSYVTASRLDLRFGTVSRALVAGLLVFAAGWLVSGFIMGLYLLVSLNVFGRHSNEAFSALRVRDWKYFLRLRIDNDGTLTIFPIGMERVPRVWERQVNGPDGPSFVPARGQGVEPRLIEDPIVVVQRKDRSRVATGT